MTKGNSLTEQTSSSLSPEQEVEEKIRLVDKETADKKWENLLSYLKEKGQWLLEPPDLCRHSGILFTGRVRMHSEFLVRGTEEARYRFKSVLRFDSILAAKEAAVSGAGIALDIPLHHCFRDILEGRLVPVLSGWHVPNLNNCIAAANTAARLRRVQLFIRWYIGRRREIEEGQKKVLFEKFGLAY